MKTQRKKSSQPTLTDHLSPDNKLLRGIFLKLAQLRPLNSLLKTCIDPVLAEHCQIVGVRNDALIMVLDNAHWATQLRFLTPTILEMVRTYPGLHGLKTLQTKIRPAYSQGNRNTPERSLALLSEKNAQLMSGLAENIQDENLRAILLKIAQHTK